MKTFTYQFRDSYTARRFMKAVEDGRVRGLTSSYSGYPIPLPRNGYTVSVARAPALETARMFGGFPIRTPKDEN